MFAITGMRHHACLLAEIFPFDLFALTVPVALAIHANEDWQIDGQTHPTPCCHLVVRHVSRTESEKQVADLCDQILQFGRHIFDQLCRSEARS